MGSLVGWRAEESRCLELSQQKYATPPKKNTEKNNDVKKWKKIFRNNDIIRNSGVYM